MLKISGANGSIFCPFFYVGIQKNKGIFHQFISDIFNSQRREFSSTPQKFTLRLHLVDEEDTGFPKGYHPNVNNVGTNALMVVKQNKELIVQREPNKALVPIDKRKEAIICTQKNEELVNNNKK